MRRHPSTSWYACGNRPDHPGIWEWEQGVHQQACRLLPLRQPVWHAAYQIPGRPREWLQRRHLAPRPLLLSVGPVQLTGSLPAVCMKVRSDPKEQNGHQPPSPMRLPPSRIIIIWLQPYNLLLFSGALALGGSPMDNHRAPSSFSLEKSSLSRCKQKHGIKIWRSRLPCLSF